MILDHLKNWKNYFTDPHWEIIFNELAALNEKTPEMEKKIHGDDIILKVFSYGTVNRQDDQAELESHRSYLDIHTSIIHAERIEWSPVDSLKVIKPYDEMADEVYYAKPKSVCAGMVMEPGLFVLFGPHDAHMPRLHAAGRAETVKKAVMKIRFKMIFQGCVPPQRFFF